MTAGLRWPVNPKTYPITQGFAGSHPWEPAGYLQSDGGGPKRAKRTKFRGGELRQDLHAAIDFSTPMRTPVLAPEAGKVVAAGVYSSTGEKYLMLRVHRDKTRQTVLFFTHLSRVVVQVGAQVKRGQRVALTGNSGMSTGPHLHYEVRVGSVKADAANSGRWFKWNPKRLSVGGDLAGSPLVKPS